MKPRATVVISTYNRSAALRYAVRSVMKQTVEELQILVVGDACTDDSGEVVEALGDPRVEWINLPERWGHQSGPNNEGIRRAEAPFIFYIPHDDLWLPHHVEVFLDTFEQGADVAFGMVARVAGDGAVGIIPPAKPFNKGLPVPPCIFAHRKELAELVGGWRDHRQTEWPPEYDLLNRYFDSGATFTPVRRITAVKFPAAERPGIYKTDDVSEQIEWWARIQNEPNLEIELMGRMLEDYENRFGPKPLPEELRRFVKTAGRRIRKKFRKRYVPVERIERNKRMKGSD